MNSEADSDLGIPAPKPPDAAGWVGAPLRSWFAVNRGRFTDDALVAKAVSAGHAENVVRDELQHVIDAEASSPVRARARMIVTLLYVGGYALLAGGMLFGPGREVGYGGGPIGSAILAVALGIAWLISIVWLRRRVRAAAAAGALPVLLSLPIVLWLGVSGLCVSTGLPFGAFWS